jgi:O-antigen/teichoic acid export membrane protein
VTWLASVVVALVFAILIPVPAARILPEAGDAGWLVLGIAGNALGNLFVIPASTIRIKRLPWLFAAYNLLGFATAAGLGLWLVLVQGLGLTGLLTSIIGSNAILAVVGGAAMLRFARPSVTSPGLGESLRFSVHALPSQLIGTFGQILDRVLLGVFTDLRTLGLYAVALRFAEVLNALHGALKMSFAPFMMSRLASSGTEGKAVVVAVTPYYLIPYFAAGLGLALFVGPLVQWIGQPEYFGVERIVPWLVGVQIVGTLYFYYCNGLFLGRRTGLLTVPALTQVVVLSVASLLLVPTFDLAGLIASRYLGAIAWFALSLYLSQRVFPLDHRWAALVRLAGAATLLAVLGTGLETGSLAADVLTRSVILAAFVGLSFWLVDGGRRRPNLRTLLRPASESTPADAEEAQPAGASTWTL